MPLKKLPKDFPKHQTIGWWIELLKQYPKDTIVAIATGPNPSPYCLLSDYLSMSGKFVWIDVGPYYED